MSNNENDDLIEQPRSPDELLAMHRILRSDPQRYLRIVNRWIADDPKNASAYFSRHYAWMKIGEPRRALDDMNTVIKLQPDPTSFLLRGQVYRHLGEYEKALQDYNHGEAMDPALWQADAIGLLYQADTHARLGYETAALACCARLPNDFWTPGVHGAPGGGKAAIADKLRSIAAEARRKRT